MSIELEKIQKVVEILTLSQSWLKVYQDFDFSTDAEMLKQLPTTKKAFQNSQQIMKAYQNQPQALPLAVFVELEKLAADLLATPLEQEKMLKLLAILQKYSEAKTLLAPEIKNQVSSFLAQKQNKKEAQTESNHVTAETKDKLPLSINPEPYVKRIIACKKDLFDALKGNKQTIEKEVLINHIKNAYEDINPLATALEAKILAAMELLFGDGDVSNDTMHSAANLIIKNAFEFFDTAAEMQTHFEENVNFYTQHLPNSAEIDKILPFLSGYILKSASSATKMPDVSTSAQPNPEEKQRLQILFQQVQEYLNENALYKA